MPYGIKCQYFDDERGVMTICDIVELRVDELTLTDGQNQYEVEFYEVRPILKRMSEFDKVLNDLDLSTDFESSYYSGNGSDVIFTNTSDKTYFSDILTVYSFLIENGFDVFGLIDLRLAIDANTVF